jgi:hypothetical protein
VAKAVFAPPQPKVEVRLAPTGVYLPAAIEGEWYVERIDEEFSVADITAFGSSVQRMRTESKVTMILTLGEQKALPPPEKIEERRVEYALREQPPEIQKTIEALFQIEDGLAPDREAVVEVEATDDGPKFTVTTRPSDLPPEDDPKLRDWYKRWRRAG